MVSDGERVIVLGWDRATETPLWWQRDGLSWQRHAMPADFGGLPGEAVGGPHGVVAVGRLASKPAGCPSSGTSAMVRSGSASRPR